MCWLIIFCDLFRECNGSYAHVPRLKKGGFYEGFSVATKSSETSRNFFGKILK